MERVDKSNNKGYGVSPWGNENFLKLIVMIVAQVCEYIKTTELHILNR